MYNLVIHYHLSFDVAALSSPSIYYLVQQQKGNVGRQILNWSSSACRSIKQEQTSSNPGGIVLVLDIEYHYEVSLFILPHALCTNAQSYQDFCGKT